ncbi:MAG: hypothetical protein IJW34_09385 [Clostridia bacterium]|nr:hypothetical protein [Clostridia bacterium]
MQFWWRHIKNPFENALQAVHFREVFSELSVHIRLNPSRCLFARNEFGQATQLLKSLRDEKSYYNFSENGSFRQGKFFGVFKNLFFKKGS